MQEATFDAIVVGGGPAGCATVLSLVHSHPGATFLLLDDADPTVFKIGESLPAKAKRTLGYLSSNLLARLIQDTTLGKHTQCPGNASAWSSTELYDTYAITNPFGMSWHLDRAAFDEMMRDTVRDIAESQTKHALLCSVEKGKFISAEKGQIGWQVHAEAAGIINHYQSKLLIDATGRKASVAHKLGARTVKSDSLLAFYALFSSTSEDTDHRTLIEASESGWWYTSQLSNNRRVVAYHTGDTDPSSRLARKQDGFLDLLNSHTTYISRAIVDCDYSLLLDTKYPRCTAANSSRLEPFCDEKAGWFAVGDAAMAFDPLSSQGMITALEMGCYLGNILAKRLCEGNAEEEEKNERSIQEIFEMVRMDYEEKKKNYYDQVRIFDGEFWRNRQ